MTATLTDFNELIEFLEIQDTDFLLVGDGASRSDSRRVSWAGILLSRHAASIKQFRGVMTPGTIAEAESMPTIQAINWIVRTYRRWLHRQRGRPVTFDLVTDSVALQSAINDRQAKLKLARSVRIASILEARQRGFLFRAHRPHKEVKRLHHLCHVKSYSLL